MKDQTEKRVEHALKTLHETLRQNITDVGVVLDEYEASHNDYELCESRHYNALLAGWTILQEAMNKMNKRLNKK